MDTVIQSLVQSPYMRTMAVVPSKSENMVHGISDHLPPYSRQKIHLRPVSGSGLNTTWRFDIPRVGLLHKALLCVRMKVNTSTHVPLQSVSDSNLFYANVIRNIELFSKQKFIERLIPECIPTAIKPYVEMFSIDHFIQSYRQGQTNTGLPDGVSLPTHMPNLTDANESQFLEFHIPLPLCSLSSIKKNFQTQFVEQLSLLVTTAATATHAVTAYDLTLKCDFHQFHPNVETAIRNSNYQASVPATLPWYDWIEFDRVLTKNDQKVTFSLRSDALISDLVIVPISTSTTTVSGKRSLAAARYTTIENDLYIVVQNNTEVLFESSLFDLTHWMHHDCILDEDDHRSTHVNFRLNEKDDFIHIPLSLLSKNEVFTGGIALSSLSSPTVTVYANESVYRGSAASVAGVTTFGVAEQSFLCFGKRHFLLRIDSDTGVVARTIES